MTHVSHERHTLAAPGERPRVRPHASGALRVNDSLGSRINAVPAGAGATETLSSWPGTRRGVTAKVTHNVLAANSSMSCGGPLLRAPLSSAHGIPAPKSTGSQQLRRQAGEGGG